MADDTPEKAPPQSPPDPFTPDHMGFVAILHMYRGLREAGGGIAESAILVGGIIRTGRDDLPPGA